MVEVAAQSSQGSSHRGYAGVAGTATIQPLSEVKSEKIVRISSTIGELDRVLGGGMVPGSVMLLGGDPGIGKSTLLLQVMAALSDQVRVLYVSGEESLAQIAMRANRLDVPADHLKCLSETRVEAILSHAQEFRPDVLVIDSVQTLFTEQLTSAPGSVAQVREASAQLVRMAKTQGVATFLVGHVTKEGGIAGPKVLAHMVDAVLFFEGDSSSRYRVIRALKNRFGAVNELGVFAMTEKGLKPVANPSAMFLSGRTTGVSGSIVMVSWEGTRPLLVEVQALVDSGSGGHPKRVSIGVDHQRLALLLAVMHRQAHIPVSDQDVFISVVGGVRVMETASDLAVGLAILSSLRDQPLPPDLIAFGELGLGGEVRPVPYGEERLQEAAKHGFKTAIVPKRNMPRKSISGLKVIGVERLSQALEGI